MASNSDPNPNIEDLQNDTSDSEISNQNQDVQIIKQTNQITDIQEMKKLVNKYIV